MSTSQSSSLQTPSQQPVKQPFDAPRDIGGGTMKSTTHVGPPRSISVIEKEIAETEASVTRAMARLAEAQTMASPDNRAKMLLLGTMAGLQEQADQAKQDADYDRIVNGENPEGSGPVLNPLRLLSVDLAKKVIGALDTIKRSPVEIRSLAQHRDGLMNELVQATLLLTPQPTIASSAK
jgi:hypothetical protein